MVNQEKNNISTNSNVGLVPEDKQKSGVEKGLEKVAEDLQVKLPETDQPWQVKIIALFTLVGGLSIVGSTFADIFDPTSIKPGLYILRLFAGFVFLLIAYGIIKRERWSIWFYGFMVILGVFTSSVILLVVPLLIVAYLYTQRAYFRESIFDVIIRRVFKKIISLTKF